MRRESPTEEGKKGSSGRKSFLQMGGLAEKEGRGSEESSDGRPQTSTVRWFDKSDFGVWTVLSSWNEKNL